MAEAKRFQKRLTDVLATGLKTAGIRSAIEIEQVKGNLRWLHRGYKAGDEGEYLNQIRALLKE